MLQFLISILIVYGITLIVVQGKIFEPIKLKLSLLINWLQNKIDPTDEAIAQWIANGNLGDNHQLLWNESLRRLNEATSETISEASLFNKRIFEDIRKEITSHSKLIKFLFLLFNKLQTLLQCMMCSGFWVGILVCLISLFFHISIFGLSLHIITATGYNILPAIFMMACLFSGTTWIIHNVVDLLYEVKEWLLNKG